MCRWEYSKGDDIKLHFYPPSLTYVPAADLRAEPNIRLAAWEDLSPKQVLRLKAKEPGFSVAQLMKEERFPSRVIFKAEFQTDNNFRSFPVIAPL